MRVWIVNAYALPERFKGGIRHIGIAHGLIKQGVQPLLVVGDFNHVEGRSIRDEIGITDPDRVITDRDGLRFRWIPSIAYQGNGIARLMNMMQFAWKVWRMPLPKDEKIPDVIVGSSLHLPGAFAAFQLAKRYKTRFVLELRDIWPETLTLLGHLPVWHPFVILNWLIARYLYRRSTVIITSMPLVESHIRKCGARLSTKFFWIPNGCFIDQSVGGAFRKEEIPTKDGQQKPFELVYAGSLGYANSIEELLDACAFLTKWSSSESLRVSIFGDGPELANLKEKVKEMRLDFVTFYGRRSREEVHKRLMNANASVLMIRPSPIYEWGYSMSKLADYMLASKPVLISDVSPYNPIRDCGGGLSYKSGSAKDLAKCILELLEVGEMERIRMGEAAREYARQNFDFEMLAKKYMKALEWNSGDQYRKSS